MKTLYAIGTRVSLTPCVFAHFSMMSSEASWRGFFIYPTFSSRSCACAEKGPVERARPIAVATHSRMRLRSLGIVTSLKRACCQHGPTDHHTPLPPWGQPNVVACLGRRLCCNSSTETWAFQAHNRA